MYDLWLIQLRAFHLLLGEEIQAWYDAWILKTGSIKNEFQNWRTD